MQPAEVPEDEVYEFRRVEPGETGEPEPGPRPEPQLGTDRAETGKSEIGNGIEAEYMLEASAVCPHCLEDIEKVQVVRMLRTKVNFVSSLPRRGQLLVCPKCRVTLAGALGGLI